MSDPRTKTHVFERRLGRFENQEIFDAALECCSDVFDTLSSVHDDRSEPFLFSISNERVFVRLPSNLDPRPLEFSDLYRHSVQVRLYYHQGLSCQDKVEVLKSRK